MSSLLNVDAIEVCYGEFKALHGVSMSLQEGRCAAVVGANGAGKSTLMQAIVGSLPKAAGRVMFAGTDITGLPAQTIVRKGMAIVPEGRRLFPSLSVEENLLIGGDMGRRGHWSLQALYALFPRLQERRSHPSTLLSGGEQQMVAIGRALMTNPRLLLCDELSLGLSPLMVREIYAALDTIVAQGVSVLLVEQDLGLAMARCSHLVCLREGAVVLQGEPDVLDRTTIKEAYFGLHHA
jgi:branched-chain amino acid transport system ATP-binding protein